MLSGVNNSEMQKFEESLLKLESQIKQIIQKNKKMNKDLEDLKLELKEKNETFLLLYKENKHLEEENKKIKIVSAISGNQEYRKLMKLRINKLISEVENCINQLNRR